MIVILVLFFFACGGNPGASETTEPELPQAQATNARAIPVKAENGYAYNLLAPLARHEMPLQLQEGSCLSMMGTDKVVMMNDEHGHLFVFDLPRGEVIDRYRIRKDGDYEGVEIVDDVLYILRSDGRVYEVSDFTTENRTSEKYETELVEGDTEGLGYDPETNQLLIACKNPVEVKGRKGEDYERAIYGFDLKEKKLSEEPFLVISFKAIKEWLEINANTSKEKERAEDFDEKKKSSFMPSGIAVHPETGHYFLIASSGQLFLEVDREGEIIHAQHLPRKLYPQPEGICFLPDGSLLISNEGRTGRGSLLRFAYQP
ncbi:MAG: SdiA-regulated domain-containing protein [Bacteroidota bacterium]